MIDFIPLIRSEFVFPNPRFAPDNMPIAFGGDLSPTRLLLAYKMGIFPWFNEGDPILWWSPNPRTILLLNEYKSQKSLLKIIKKGIFEIRVDYDFLGTIIGCQKAKRSLENGTWITDAIIEAYYELHKLGYAHSFETYLDNKLVGGLYGVSLGRAFFGESMFSNISNASKVALYHLVLFCKKYSFDFIDAQVRTEHMINQGAKDIDRELFLNMLEETLKKETISGSWMELYP